ncbi:MAG: sigma-70 family RNA polymerase sigma factor [Planctomycetota bacterium]
MENEGESNAKSDPLRTNSALILGLQSAEAWAWKEFGNLYNPLLIGWARSCGFNATDAEEFLSELVKRLAQSLKGFEYDRSKSFRGYLRTVLRSIISKELERRSRFGQAFSLDDIDQPIGSSGRSILDIVADKELEARLIDIRREVLESVSEAERCVWVARDQNEASVDDLAKELGISKQTVYRYKSQVGQQMHQRILEITNA